MPVTLGQAKSFLKIDSDITEDDDLISNLINAAAEYVQNTTGKKNNGSAVYDQCILLLVAHWHENRTIIASKPGTLSQLPHSVTALMQHIANCDKYPKADDKA